MRKRDMAEATYDSATRELLQLEKKLSRQLALALRDDTLDTWEANLNSRIAHQDVGAYWALRRILY